MKLLCIFAAILALSLAESEKKHKTYEDSEVAKSIGLQQVLKPAASYYPHTSVPSYPPWNKPQYIPQPTWPNNQYPTTTPVAVIKNEQYNDGNGNYKYEYKLSDGTWVGEQGYYTSPMKENESLVKTGWYQFRGADGKVYTVTYWADHTGYHANGDHLPTHASTTQKPIYPPQTQYPSQPPQQTHYPVNPPPPQFPTYPPQQPLYPPQQPQYPQPRGH